MLLCLILFITCVTFAFNTSTFIWHSPSDMACGLLTNANISNTLSFDTNSGYNAYLWNWYVILVSTMLSLPFHWYYVLFLHTHNVWSFFEIQSLSEFVFYLQWIHITSLNVHSLYTYNAYILSADIHLNANFLQQLTRELLFADSVFNSFWLFYE